MDKNQLFNELMENREGQLYRIAFSYVKNREDALVCLQDTLLKGYSSFDQLRDREYFDTWIIRILMNTCIDFQKSRKYFNDIEELEIGEIEKNAEETMDLLQSLDKLSPDHREVLVLRYFQDLSNKEISQLLDIKEGTVKSRLSRALDKLKILLD